MSDNFKKKLFVDCINKLGKDMMKACKSVDSKQESNNSIGLKCPVCGEIICVCEIENDLRGSGLELKEVQLKKESTEIKPCICFQGCLNKEKDEFCLLNGPSEQPKPDSDKKVVMTKSLLSEILKKNSDNIDCLIFKLVRNKINARTFREELAKEIMKVINNSSEMTVVDNIMKLVRGNTWTVNT